MIIPGILISAITFPGVMVHELAHQIFCRLFRIPVFKVVYFQMKNPCGYVLHEATDEPLKVFMTSMGPFFVNTILGMMIMAPVAVPIFTFSDYSNPLNIILAWVGISILMHAFPSTGDAKVMVNCILKNKNVKLFVKIITAPFIGLVYLGAAGSIFWLDFFYGIGVAMIVPRLLALF